MEHILQERAQPDLCNDVYHIFVHWSKSRYKDSSRVCKIISTTFFFTNFTLLFPGWISHEVCIASWNNAYPNKQQNLQFPKLSFLCKAFPRNPAHFCIVSNVKLTLSTYIFKWLSHTVTHHHGSDIVRFHTISHKQLWNDISTASLLFLW